MAASKHHPAHDWDLWLVVYAIVALSAATDICGFQRFAPTLGLPVWAGILCVVPIKLIEWQFLTFANRLFQNGLLGKTVSPVPVVAWCLAVCLSMLAAHSTIYNLLASADRITANSAETRANLVATFEGRQSATRHAVQTNPAPREGRGAGPGLVSDFVRAGPPRHA